MHHNSASLQIVVAGGGLGGLTLAQRLRDSRHRVTVLESRPRNSTAHGYRVSLKAGGIAALQSSLPRELFELVVATRIRQARQMIFMNPDLTTRFSKPLPLLDPADALGVNRQTLREILAMGLDIRYDAPVTSYASDGYRVTVHAGDAHYEADLLVGADGTNSAVRRQLLPGARLDDLGWAIWGRTPITGSVQAWLPPELDETFNRVIHEDGAAMSVVTCRTHESPSAATRRLGIDHAITDVPDYLSWMVSPNTSRTDDAAPGALQQQALDTVRGWHPALEQIINGADPADVFAVRIRSSHPVDPWHEVPVTLLGDAIHTMSPGRGDGANIAIRDAELLGDLLAQAEDASSLHAAARQYEAEMLDYGFRAVAASRDHPFAPFTGTSKSGGFPGN